MMENVLFINEGAGAEWRDENSNIMIYHHLKAFLARGAP
jgi:hypothetical protein